MTNEQFEEKWKAAFPPTTRDCKTCSEAAIEIEELIRNNQVQVLRSVRGTQASKSIRVLQSHGVEPLTGERHTCAFGTDNSFYFLTECKAHSDLICFRHGPADSGVNNEDIGELIDEGFPAGSADQVTEDRMRFLGWVSGPYVELYMPDAGGASILHRGPESPTVSSGNLSQTCPLIAMASST